jgi:RimJ/RimL family protein N-acetyltransferase
MTRLRKMTEADIDVLDRQREDPDAAGEFSWFGFKAGGMRRRWDAGEVLTEHQGVLAVVDDNGRLVGDVSWIRMHNAPPPNGDCWNVGIWIVPEERGKGHGSEAQRLAAAYLFAHTYLERVEAGTEGGNLAEQRALEKAGFTREGVLRKACFRDGEWRDMVVYSKLRGEP